MRTSIWGTKGEKLSPDQTQMLLAEAAREQGLDTAARKALRQEKSAPLMQTLHTRLREIRQQIAPGSKLAQACDYALRNGAG